LVNGEIDSCKEVSLHSCKLIPVKGIVRLSTSFILLLNTKEDILKLMAPNDLHNWRNKYYGNQLGP